jgi:uncharacterized membrane protein
MKVLIAPAIVLMCMFSLFADASAGLEYCNHSRDSVIYVAAAYEKGSGWVSQGWWELRRGECKTAIAHRLRNQYYYYRGDTKSGGSYSGNHFFCADDQEFLYHDAKSCSQNNSKGFKELNVGNSGNFTMNFTGKRSGRD